ncbi:UDP-N-acetylmuramoylalanyl-D-glutamate--2,6-diaminopimelate ligase [Bacteroidetes bacterium UKL13-3]|nr:UDP-N-acetylmuramoylalanyl-D-glutamate--2,6-diaminopimelate ligase [Bacteroidetes bacterium UKL13-3]HCP92916.1 UDP-N-acetylmuramoyl-L-alanyl-D-glutamate--2,6-diaminopimelate ligase [Bacteroidota bacterium]
MKTIAELIQHSSVKQVIGDTQLTVLHLTYDSRNVGEGSLFFAVKGTQVDGHTFIQSVIEKGAAAIVCETLPATLDETVTYIQVNNTSEAMANIAAEFYNHPSRKLKLTAVTGTNGKTTVATLLFKLFRSFGYNVGLLSTVQNQINEEIIPSTHTTPDSIRINELLEMMVDNGCEYCFMEASSHAIDQNRIEGLHFAGTIFNNITHDHLDYHLTFDNYIKAKKKLFDTVNEDAFALTNKDDKNGMVMLQNTKATKYTFSLNSMADFKAKIIESDFNGMLLNIDGDEAWFRLVGNFNAYNLLAVYGAAFLLGKEKREIITHLSSIESVKGRFEYVRSENGVIAVVDYAHTPDALENVLSTINQLRTKNEQLITIVGCGGNRDAAKRPVMADVATELSTKVIFTSDNPRNENPETILDDMQKGVKPLHYKKTLRIADRKEAIKTAISMAAKGDIILVAGKGHENYQEIKGVKHHFDDKETVLELFKLMN